MVSLNYNETFCIAAGSFPPIGPPAGCFRVVVNSGDYLIAASIWMAGAAAPVSRNGPITTPRRRPSANGATSNVGRLFLLPSRTLSALDALKQIQPVRLDTPRPDLTWKCLRDTVATVKTRTTLATHLLDPDRVELELLANGGLNSLFSSIAIRHGVPRRQVVNVWTLLCRYGFQRASLIPRDARSAAVLSAQRATPMDLWNLFHSQD